MNITCKAAFMKEWTLTDDRIIYGKNEILLTDITEVTHTPCKNASSNGAITIWVAGKFILLAYPHKQKEDGEAAVKYILENVSDSAKPKEPEAPKEYRKKCNVCGHIMCYTDKDLRRNKVNSTSAKISSLASGLNAIAGTAYNMYEQQKQADAANAQIVDYNKCPKCNSTDLADITDMADNTTPTISATSAADELKKFKELLDMGVITQEEFDAKKKELLGL